MKMSCKFTRQFCHVSFLVLAADHVDFLVGALMLFRMICRLVALKAELA